MIILLFTALIAVGWSLPLVDPGLFVISGVQTCGNGSGYCLLGADCRLNQDFVPDLQGHCSGLKGAFTPVAHFVCCTSPQDVNELHKPGEVHRRPGGSRPSANKPPVVKPQGPPGSTQPQATYNNPPKLANNNQEPKPPLFRPHPGGSHPVQSAGNTQPLQPSLIKPQQSAVSSQQHIGDLLNQGSGSYPQPSSSDQQQTPLVAQTGDNWHQHTGVSEMPKPTTGSPLQSSTSHFQPVSTPQPTNAPEGGSINDQKPANSQVLQLASNTKQQMSPTLTPPVTAPKLSDESLLLVKQEHPATKDQLELTTTEKLDVTTEEAETETVSTGRQTITSPPDYMMVGEENEAENNIDWEGLKNFTEVVTDFCPPCKSQAVFFLDNAALCQGTYLRHGWVLTSGACALRVFRAGMIKVVGKYLQDPEVETLVKTIAVHEDYRPYSANVLHPEPNNIGLILLSAEPKKSCSPCLPDKDDKFAGKICSTTANSTTLSIKINKQDKVANDDVCEGILETMQGEASEDFYTVACDSNYESRYNGEESSESGKGLMCRGYIAGIETSSGTGLVVFTKVSQHSDWITTNMMQEQRQSFDTDTAYQF